jgi:uncharacterized phosphosugar-binding protein
MLSQRYLDRIRQMLDEIEQTQLSKIEQAGQMIAHSLAHEGAFFITPIGHGAMPELLHRGGGLVCLRGFNPTWQIAAEVAACRRDRPRADEITMPDEMMRAAVRASEIRPGDCVLMGSVSGRTISAVSLALALKEHGATVIALVALDYAAQVESAHPSGQLLSDIADLVIDVRAPYGDGSLEVTGIEAPCLPISGVAQATICWAVCGAVIEQMLARGLTPGVYMSANRAGGPEYNRQLQIQFDQSGY